jgi:hypothetical protein
MNWIECGKTWGEMTAFNAKDKPLVAGVQIEVRSFRHGVFHTETMFLLIGEINEMGGTCDDCSGIGDKDIVVRYRVLVDQKTIDGKES